MPKANFHQNLEGPDWYVIVNHVKDMTAEKITQFAEKVGAVQDDKYFVLLGNFGALPELYTKNQIAEKLSELQNH
ncbi:MAG TPA: hypothetical protein PLD95_02615 [bacterium]|jgi:dihydroxyacetone kinase|nr:hypothetical protein [bacterium]HQI03245.1 hypothetical protein [bacterium]